MKEHGGTDSRGQNVSGFHSMPRRNPPIASVSRAAHALKSSKVEVNGGEDNLITPETGTSEFHVYPLLELPFLI